MKRLKVTSVIGGNMQMKMEYLLTKNRYSRVLFRVQFRTWTVYFLAEYQ